MPDFSGVSDDELRQRLKQAQAEANTYAATHFGAGIGSGTDLPYDPAAQGGTFHVGPFDTGIGTSKGVDRVLSGTGRGMSSIIRNTGNLLAKLPPMEGGMFPPGMIGEAARAMGAPDDAQLLERNKEDQPLLDTQGGSFGNTVGQAAITAPLTMGASEAVGALGPLGQSLMGNPISRGAFEGGLQGLLSSEPGKRASGTLLGAGAGAAIPATGLGIKKLAYGMTQTPESQMLRGMGVDLTPGQMNPKGTMNTLEQAWESVPVLGNVVKGARGNAEEQFQQAVIGQAGAPGATLPKADSLAEALDNAYQSFDSAYGPIKGYPVAGTRTGIGRGLATTANDPSVLADDNARKTVSSWLSNKATQLPSGQQLTSGDLMSLRSEIRSQIRGVSDDAQRELLENAEQALTQHINSQLPPDAAAALAQTDAQYAKYKILENAMRKAKDRPGGFTQSQLAQAIQEATDPGTYARGGGLMRDLSSAGSKTFQTTMPNTGGRNAAIAMTFAGAPIAAPAGFGMVGTQTGRALMAGETAPQKLVQALIEGGSKSMSASQKRLLVEAIQRLGVASAQQPLASGTGSP